MILNYELAQKFVDNIIEKLGHNVNIMNEFGIIIASGEKERIGSYHKISEEVIKNKKRIDIFKEDEHKYSGVKEGINMPFYYKNAIGGVVGITGNPLAIEKTVQIVKMVLELMIEQEFLKERVYSEQSQTTFFVDRLLDIKNDDDILAVSQWATKLNYDIKIPRIVCIISIQNIESLKANNPLYTKVGIKERVLKEIKNGVYSDNQDIISNIEINKIILFKTVSSVDKDKYYKKLMNHLKNITDNLFNRYKLELLIGVGTYHEGIKGLKESYTEAKGMLSYGENIGNKNGIFIVDDYILEYLFTKIPIKYFDHFLIRYIDKIKNNTDIIETIESLVNNNMNVVRTSEDLFIHRNTVLFRINKIKEILEINPLHNDKDRELLRLITWYMKYREFNK